ncbi:hypothetical protein Avbf_11788, partial [Armadillidium vulgare]
ISWNLKASEISEVSVSIKGCARKAMVKKKANKKSSKLHLTEDTYHGGFLNLLNIANKGHRLEFFNMNPSITERYNFYNTFFNGLFAFGAAYSITPTYAQRVCAVKTIDEAKR